MTSKLLVRSALIGLVACLLAADPARAGFISVSHPSPSSIPGSSSPLIEMQTVSINNNGTSMTFHIQFFNPTVEGPSSGNSDAVYGFFDLDTDKNKATGLGPAALNASQGGFGQYSDPRLGIDAYISLSSEGDAFGHNFIPGLVDLIRASDGSIIDTVAITYGASPASLTFTLPDADFATLPGFPALQAGGTPDFSAIVGNANNATDVLSSVTAAAVPEPSAIFLVVQGAVGIALLGARRPRRVASAAR